MDPQSQAFTPQIDSWRLTQSVRRLEETQQEYAERLLRIEKRLDDEARMKSVWGSSSPFPGVLSGTPQHGPTHQSSSAEFANFDDDQSNAMARSLQLDTDDEPRRMGATSRTNSVRFDESANQAQWSHGPRTSVDLFTRSSSGLSGLGGHPLLERSSSHKSDGRHSSTGHSIVSGRANSLGLEMMNPFGNPPSDTPGLAPGLFILGSVPAIIRCWLTTSFKSDSLLYAAVCTGSYRSYLDARLIKELGYSDRIRHDISKNRKIKLPMYFPEAVPQMASSRSSSPAPQLPSLTIDFTVVEPTEDQIHSKSLKIFIGSDTLRAHNADVLFSSNSLTLFDDERNKLAIPLVRPENEESFKSLYITSSPLPQTSLPQTPRRLSGLQQPSMTDLSNSNILNGIHVVDDSAQPSQETGLLSPIARPERSMSSRDNQRSSTEEADSEQDGSSTKGRVELSRIDTSKEDKKERAELSPTNNSAASRSNATSSAWNSWRRESSNNYSQGDYANASRNLGSSYARPSREQGIKVLRPTRATSRSSNAPLSASPVTGQSRFFDDGKRRNGNSTDSNEIGDVEQGVRGVSLDLSKQTSKENVANALGARGRGANPIGGASAFGWLNSRSQK